MKNKFKTIISIIHEKGILTFLHVAIKKIFPSNNPFLAWETRNLLRYSLVSGSRLFRLPQTFEAFCLNKSQHNELTGLNDMSDQSIELAVKNKEYCWVVKDNQRIVAYVWISDNKQRIFSDTGYEIPLQVGEKACWWRDLYVLPDYRGKSLVELLFTSWIASVSDNITDVLYTEVSPANIASVKVHSRLGFHKTSRLIMFCILGLRLYIILTPDKFMLKSSFYPHWLY